MIFNPFSKKKVNYDPWESITQDDRQILLMKSCLNEEKTAELIRLYFEVLAIPAPSGEEGQIRDYIVQKMESWGITDYQIDRSGNLHIRTAADNYRFADNVSSQPSIGFTAHMDTHLRRKESMTPRIEGRKVINKSSAILGGDDRTAIAAFMILAKEARFNKVTGNIHMIFTVHEENMRNRGWSYGARSFDPEILNGIDILLSMDVPSGKKISERNFLVYHMADDDNILDICREAAGLAGIASPYLESERGGFIGGDATVFYQERRKKVLDFGTGNFHEHTRQEFTDLEIYLEQFRWIYETFQALCRKSKSDLKFPLPA